MSLQGPESLTLRTMKRNERGGSGGCQEGVLKGLWRGTCKQTPERRRQRAQLWGIGLQEEEQHVQRPWGRTSKEARAEWALSEEVRGQDIG